jgi:hypothetical protein
VVLDLEVAREQIAQLYMVPRAGKYRKVDLRRPVCLPSCIAILQLTSFDKPPVKTPTAQQLALKEPEKTDASKPSAAELARAALLAQLGREVKFLGEKVDGSLTSSPVALTWSGVRWTSWRTRTNG